VHGQGPVKLVVCSDPGRIHIRVVFTHVT
jgi:hypothetical protein